MADIPIKFHYFEKLKLYHDFLKKSRMLESTKRQYWLLGKLILLWAYSPHHQHFGRPLDFSVFLAQSHSSTLQKFAKKLISNESDYHWFEENAKNTGIIIQVIENLDVLGFIETLSRFNDRDIEAQRIHFSLKNYTDQFRITLKGFLLGELLNEKIDHPKWFKVKYYFTDLLLQIAFFLLIISAIVIAIKQIF